MFFGITLIVPIKTRKSSEPGVENGKNFNTRMEKNLFR